MRCGFVAHESWVLFGFKTLNLKGLCLANLAMNHSAEIPKMATYSVYESDEPDPSYFPGHNIVKYGKNQIKEKGFQ